MWRYAVYTSRNVAPSPAFAATDEAGIPIPTPVVIDWNGSAFGADTGSTSASSSDYTGWMTDFVNHLGRNESERNPNAKIKVLVPPAVLKTVADAAKRIGTFFS